MTSPKAWGKCHRFVELERACFVSKRVIQLSDEDESTGDLVHKIQPDSRGLVPGIQAVQSMPMVNIFCHGIAWP